MRTLSVKGEASATSSANGVSRVKWLRGGALARRGGGKFGLGGKGLFSFLGHRVGGMGKVMVWFAPAQIDRRNAVRGGAEGVGKAECEAPVRASFAVGGGFPLERA